MVSKPISPAPWRSSFLSHISKMESPTFTLSTLHAVDSSSASTPSFVPRSRVVVYRGLWGSLPKNPKNTAEMNPDVYETDLVTITTDARMAKVSELVKSASGEVSGSGGGGPVEATFWAEPARTQWRIRGHAYILGPDIDSEALAPLRAIVEKHMRSNGDTSSWSWSRELTAHFGNLSPGMRGSFRNPPPGTPLTEKPAEGLGRGQKVEDLHDAIARKNFRVVVILPEEVDRTDLTDPAKARRWNYKLTAASWETTELWP